MLLIVLDHKAGRPPLHGGRSYSIALALGFPRGSGRGVSGSDTPRRSARFGAGAFARNTLRARTACGWTRCSLDDEEFTSTWCAGSSTGFTPQSAARLRVRAPRGDRAGPRRACRRARRRARRNVGAGRQPSMKEWCRSAAAPVRARNGRGAALPMCGSPRLRLAAPQTPTGRTRAGSRAGKSSQAVSGCRSDDRRLDSRLPPVRSPARPAAVGSGTAGRLCGSLLIYK